jgi:hypothetical protein
LGMRTTSPLMFELHVVLLVLLFAVVRPVLVESMGLTGRSLIRI